jgi:hypothetical protein
MVDAAVPKVTLTKLHVTMASSGPELSEASYGQTAYLSNLIGGERGDSRSIVTVTRNVVSE